MKDEDKSFLKSNAVVFISNLITSVGSYIIVILASRILQTDYSSWVALSGAVSIFATFTNGVQTSTTKNISKNSDNPSQVINLIEFYDQNLFKLLLLGVLISPVIALILNSFRVDFSFLVVFLISLHFFCSPFFSYKQFALLSLSRTWEYSILNVISAFFRLIFSFLILILGFKLLALPAGLILSLVIVFYISTIFLTNHLKKILNQKESSKEMKNTTPIKFNSEIKHLVLNTLSTLGLILFLNIGPIIIQLSNLKNESKDLLAILFSFGQIIHFGAISAVGTLIVSAAKSSNKNIYLWSVGIVGSISGFIACLFLFFGKAIMEIFGREQFSWAIWLVFLYAIYILLYNIIFVTIQYQISRNQYLSSWVLILGVITQLSYLFLTNLGIFKFQLLSNSSNLETTNQLLPYIVLNIATAAVTLILTIFLARKNPNN